jgi:hypothetical protein
VIPAIQQCLKRVDELDQRLLAEQTNAGKEWRKAALAIASGADEASALFRPHRVSLDSEAYFWF